MSINPVSASSLEAQITAVSFSKKRPVDLLERINEDLTQLKGDLATLQGLPSGITPTQLQSEYSDLFSALTSDVQNVDGDINDMQDSNDPLVQGVMHNTDGEFNKIASLFQRSKIGGNTLEDLVGEMDDSPSKANGKLATYFSVLLNTSGQGDLDAFVNAIQKFLNNH